MQFQPEVISVVFGLAVIANRLVEAIFEPLLDRITIDHLWLKYIAWLLAAILVYFTGANLFESVIPNAVVGQILTALVSGGGANLLHDLAE